MNDSDPNPLRDRLAALPRDIPPARDLWPEIQARLDADCRAAASRQAKSHSQSGPAIPPRRDRPYIWLSLAATVALAAGLYWFRSAPIGASWAVDSLAGNPHVGRKGITGTARLNVGQWLETDASSRAKLTVGMIGEVSLEPNSRLRIVNTAVTDHRLELARGTMHALIWAPPRLFFVETPSGTAIDLGCAYTLTVDDHGAGTLEVTSGYVALEYAGLESITPAGLMCRTRPGFGPGTPFAVNTAPELRDALAQFDTGDDSALPRILTAAAEGDGVTLWHLLTRAPETARGRVFDRLARLHPPPAGVTRAGIIAGDAVMHNLWAETVGLFAGLNPKP